MMKINHHHIWVNRIEQKRSWGLRPIVLGPRTLLRTWGTRPSSLGTCYTRDGLLRAQYFYRVDGGGAGRWDS